MSLGLKQLMPSPWDQAEEKYANNTVVPGKVTRLAEWLGSQGWTLASFSASWFYSDSQNDLPLLERVTHPVAVDPDEILRREASTRGWRIISLE